MPWRAQHRGHRSCCPWGARQRQDRVPPVAGADIGRASPARREKPGGGRTRRDSKYQHKEERKRFFAKRGSPPARSRHTRAAKSHLQPSGELGQEQQISASSFRTSVNTEHAQDDCKKILSSDLCHLLWLVSSTLPLLPAKCYFKKNRLHQCS